MSGRFDPYHQWLGIPPRDQPPHHYRLLGIPEFEDDPRVIESAADRQMAFLRKHQSGSESAQALQLLNEMSRARLCLLKAEAKSAYDAGLRAAMENPGRKNANNRSTKAASPAGSAVWTHPAVVGGLVMTILLAGALIWLAITPATPAQATVANSNVSSTAEPNAQPPSKQQAPGLPESASQAGSGSATSTALEPVVSPAPGISPAESAVSESPQPSVSQTPNASAQANVPTISTPVAEVMPPTQSQGTAAATPDTPAEPAVTSDKPTAEKRAVPETAAQTAALKDIKTQHQTEYGQAKSDEKRLFLARTLLEQARADQSDAARTYVLFQEAALLASQAGDSSLSAEAVHELTDQFQVSSFVIEERIFTANLTAPKTLDAAHALAMNCQKLATQAAAADEYVAATKVLQAGVDQLKKPGYKSVKDELAGALKHMTGLRDAFEMAKVARETLKTNSSDQKASLTWGSFLLFHKGDAAGGLPLLAQSGDKVWGSLADRTEKLPSDTTELLKLGDDWFAAGNKEPDPIRYVTREQASSIWETAWSRVDESERAKFARDFDLRYLKLFDKSVFVSRGDPGGFNLNGSERFNPTEQFTLEFWMSTQTAKGAVISKVHGNEKDAGLVIHLDQGIANLEVRKRGGGGGSGGGSAVDDGRWHHMALVKNPDKVILFVDGKQVVETKPDVPLISSAPWKFGATRDKNPLTGRFARLRISNTARYSEPFSPPKFYLKDANTLYPSQKNEF